MQTISYTQLRNHLAKFMGQVCDDHAPIVVHRSATDSIVIISLEEYEAMSETCYLLKSPKNATRLAGAIEFIEADIAKRKAEREK